MTDKLNDNDKQRIEQLTAEQFIKEKCGVTKWDLIYDPDLVIRLMNGYAEYATIYEREQFAGYTVNSYKSKVIKELEAERSELRNKVIEQAIDICKDYEVGWQVADIIEKLNSLKTK